MDPPTFTTPVHVSSLINNTDSGPSAGNAETSQAIKRKRLTQACDACRKKKVKCSGEKPTCNNCSRLSLHCTYLPSTRKRGPRVGLVESLEKRLQQMEKLLQPLKEQGLVDEDHNPTDNFPKKPRLDSDDSEVNNVQPVSDHSHVNSSTNFTKPPYILPKVQNKSQFQQGPESFNYLNQQNQSKSSYAPKEFLESFYQKDQTNDEKDKINLGKNEDELIYFGKTSVRPGFIRKSELPCGGGLCSPSASDCSNTSESINSEDAAQMPIVIRSNLMNDKLSIEIIEHLASCFFRFIDIQLSMFHQPTFMRQLRQNKVSAFLVYAMCAVSARYASHPAVARDPPCSAGEPFAAIANKMLFQTFDFPCVEHVQAYVLLAFHMFGTCRGPRAWMYIGMSIRMAQEIGLHKVDEISLGTQPTKAKSEKSEAAFIQKEIRRRTFWSCFLLDRFSACAVGRPTLIDEGDCDVRLPCNEAIWNYDHPYSKVLIEQYFNEIPYKQDSRISLTNNGLSACLISVATLLGRVCHFINRTKPSNSLPPWEPQSQFSILLNEIDMWYNSLNPHYTYSKDRLQKLMSNGTGVLFTSIHFIYNTCIIVLNRQNIAILQNNEVVEPDAIEFMRKSAERCSSSAKKVISICKDVLEHSPHWLNHHTAYPIFVTATIIINDIFGPDSTTAEEAKRDFEICEKYLKAMEPFCAMANKFLCVIKEMYRERAEQYESNNLFNRDSSQNNMTRSDAGLLAYWHANPINSTSNNINSIDDISSIILPEQFTSPRWFGSNLNDTSFISNDTLTNYNFLRSPGFTPRIMTRGLKKDKNDENSTENDYFSQNMFSYNYPPPSFDGFPLMDMSGLDQNNYDWSAGRDLLLQKPIKHWSAINGNNITEEPPSNSSSSSNSNITS